MEPRRKAVTLSVDEQSGAIHINTQEIPDQVRDGLAAATMELLAGILGQPGGRERLEAKKLELAALGKL